MSLSINSNLNSLNAQRHAGSLEQGVGRAIQRLSTGLRINSAADDAAGMAISQRMTSGIRGMNQAKRNINDATSLLQVADGALAQVSDNLQRLRELAVQASNSSYSAEDRAGMQMEASQIIEQITKIGEQTSFNGVAVFSQDKTSIGGTAAKQAVLDGLKSGWLTQAESLVKKYYGISGDGANLTINLDNSDGPWNNLASVSGSFGGGSFKYSNMHLNLDMADFTQTNLPDGGANPMFSDRIVAHEMVHAITARATGNNLPTWFKEGTAELIHGADERVASATSNGTDAAGVAATVSSVTAGSFSYQGAYVASRYLHSKLNEMGVDGGIKGIFLYLHDHQDQGLDQALNAVTDGAYTDQAAFLADFHANGAAFITTRMNLTNADTGAIGGFDADGGEVRTARNVVADTSSQPANDPLASLKVIFPTFATASRQMQVQIGADVGDHINLDMSAINSDALGIGGLDLTNPSFALLHLDQALDSVAKQRVNVGASSNRLGSVANGLSIDAENLAGARSRITDADYAVETAALTRSQILQQAAIAMVSQANSQPNAVLQLLR